MSIEEKPKALEFSYIPDEMKNAPEGKQVIYNISYDPTAFGEIFPVKINSGSDEMKFTLEFFEQVADFFKQKGILKPIILIRKPLSGDVPSSAVSLPVIQKKDGEKSVPVDPLMTFDISNQQNIPVEEKQIVSNAETPSVVSGPVASGPVISVPVVNSKTSEDVIDRPVIRTRVRAGDVKSAEKDAAILRGSPPQKQVIKRAKSKEE